MGAGRELSLLVRSGGWQRSFPLPERAVEIGRARECDLFLPDVSVSRHHCRLQPDGYGGFEIEDLGSRTGTEVDGVAIEGPTPLAVGSTVRLGDSELRLEAIGPESRLLSGSLDSDARLVSSLVSRLDAIDGVDDLDELLRIVVDQGLEAIDGERGALFLAGENALETAVARSRDGADLAVDEALTYSLPREALRNRRALLLTDTKRRSIDSRLLESVFSQELGSVVCVPLPGDPDPLGVLYIDSRRPARNLGPRELAVVELLAARGALAVERARFRRRELDRIGRERQRLSDENRRLRGGGSRQPIGESPVMKGLFDQLRRLAGSDATVCLLGETGTGKEVLARYLHERSPRAQQPFVVVDCGALPESLVEAELFGHERGAFTGATSSRRGRFREAQGGTVLVDEIGELPLELQPRLLRVLQERQVQPVGSDRTVAVDVRVLCATHRDLAKRVEEGTFREDLYYRIAILSLEVPPLRKRGEDILLLARHFLAAPQPGGVTERLALSVDAERALLAHDWPGNVRELERRLQRGALLASPPVITSVDLGLSSPAVPVASISTADGLLPLREARTRATEEFERLYLELLLERASGNVSEASRLAGVSRSLLHRMLKKHDLDRRTDACPPEERPGRRRPR